MCSCVYDIALLHIIMDSLIWYIFSDKHNHYEEVVFLEKPDMAATRVLQYFFYLTDRINSMGATIMLCPVIPCITKWNNSRLQQKKTSHLLHSENYKCMPKFVHFVHLAVTKTQVV